MLPKDSLKELELDLNEEVEDSWLLHAKETLGSMIASLHGVKNFLMLKLIGQACNQDVMVIIYLGASLLSFEILL